MVKSIYRFEHIFNSKTCIKDKTKFFETSVSFVTPLHPHSVPIYYMYHTGYCFPPQIQIRWSLSMGHHTSSK